VPRIQVLYRGETHTLEFEPGPSVRDILDPTDFRVRSGCRGNGACGLCRVRLVAGEGGPASPSELIHLHESLRAGGVRLACQLHPTEDLTVEVLNPAAPSNWRATPEGLWRRGDVRGHDMEHPLPGVRHPCGVAVDLGTTNICLSLFDLNGGRWLADRWGRNPQAVRGADVLTRLTEAAESPQHAREMRELAADAIGEALQDIAVREGFDLGRVACVTVVGNTAMLSLFTGRNYELLLQPENWTRPIDCGAESADFWTSRWDIHPQALVEVVPPLAGFVGSDLLVGLVATRFLGGSAPALFIDFGTNSEIALWDGETLRVTSAAGGPAFESGAGFAMPAEPGAVFRVARMGDRLDFHILGDSRPKGVCGSGLVDLIARLREDNTLSEVGNFISGSVFQFVVGGEEMALSKRDVDTFQRAKAAIGVGVRALCGDAGLRTDALQRVCVAGAFGRYLDVASAQAVGLLPTVPPERVELAGNTALAGCADVMLSSEAAARLARLRERPKVINLSRYAGFDDLFLENLYLRPLKGE
jgi:uncharacterized 2Fe-2S/4Fe-4S cluster protein (DUF4445 family)